MRKMGIDFTFVEPDCSDEELEAAFKPNTKAVFGETIANPALTVLDIEKFARAAHAHGAVSYTHLDVYKRQLLRSAGNVRIPLIGSSIAFFLNLFFNWVFIFGKLGAPRLELVGAAVGTLIARGFEFCFVFGYLILTDTDFGFRIRHLPVSYTHLGTGNSRYAASQLGQVLEDEVYPIQGDLKANREGVFDSQRPYVFVSPTYCLLYTSIKSWLC